ncbi:MAG: response regulator [Alphaproteobacteria bacterium]|nr:response regulator [Alphaproteobacteria bacterium]
MDFKKLHVLVVEDLQPMRELLVDILDTLGVGTITTTDNGEEAFRIYCRKTPDLVITDWHMSPMDGIALTKKIRTDPSVADPTKPIIMMTGYGSPERISEARDHGVTEFLVKPFSVKDLSRRLTHIIKSPRDFIVTETFAGPDRRRKVKDGFEETSKREGSEKIIRRIKASYELLTKVGGEEIDPEVIVRCQKILDNNKVNFAPLAQKYIDEIDSEIQVIKSLDEVPLHHLQNISSPVMQIKANARIFKYDRLGDLAAVMLNFLEHLNEVDDDVIKIIEAHDKSLRLIVEKEISGDGGDVGKHFQKELEDVCNRYARARSEKQKRQLEKTMREKD